jgi:3-oxoacyl-[acyl-carrier-protein] synthase II
MKPQVVITGIGMVTPLGLDARTTWKRLLRGESGIAAVTRFDASAYSSRIAGELKGFDPRGLLTARDARHTDPCMQYALAAAVEALADARFTITPAESVRVGVLIGSGRGGMTTMEKNAAALAAGGPKAVSPYFPPLSLVNMAAGFVAVRLQATGPCLDVSTACATGTHAIGEAMKMIQRGDADVMIAGGTEAAITPLVLAGFCKARAVSHRNDAPEKASRPFDCDRDGFVLAEGAGVVVIEERGHAEKRGAKIYAELAGYGLTADAFHAVRPDPSAEGPARAMTNALKDAGLSPNDVGHVNAHGTSTLQNDVTETLAIKKTFGEHAKSLAISAPKSMLGHMLGAAGAVEAALTALALKEQIAPPTINLDHPDPACDLDYVPNTARKLRTDAALSLSLGFGGVNAALVLRKIGE